MNAVYLIAGAMLLVGAVLALARAERGPTMLDRTVALDVFATVLIGGIAIEAAWSKRVDVLPILVALSLVGFIGSTTIARFASVEPASERRIREAQEVAAEDARVRAEQEAEYERARHTREVELDADAAPERRPGATGTAAPGGPAGESPAVVSDDAEVRRRDRGLR